jgi:Protein of unknown function (DUF3606)
MTDDLSRRVPEDPKKININQRWEIDYWTKTLGVTEQQLITAVKTVGPLVANVKFYFQTIGII